MTTAFLNRWKSASSTKFWKMRMQSRKGWFVLSTKAERIIYILAPVSQTLPFLSRSKKPFKQLSPPQDGSDFN